MLDPNRIKDYISLVRNYTGENDYMLSLKTRVNNSGTFNPTPKQIDYIQKNYRKKPIVLEKEITVSSYFATKLQEQHRLVFLPKKFLIVKILANGEDTLHVMVKFTEKQTNPTMVWIPKKFIIKEKVKNIITQVDYSKFSHRPPMVHQKDAVKKL